MKQSFHKRKSKKLDNKKLNSKKHHKDHYKEPDETTDIGRDFPADRFVRLFFSIKSGDTVVDFLF